jgi:penicillin-binding protein 2
MAAPREPQRYEGVERRVQVVALGIAITFSLLCVSIWRLQVINMRQFREMAEDQQVWPKRLKSDRGVIYSRHGAILADNRASTDIVLVPGEVDPGHAFPRDHVLEALCHDLQKVIAINEEQLAAKVRAHRREPFSQITIKRDVSRNDRIRIEEFNWKLPGVFTIAHPQRRYLHGETAGQLLGRLGEINQQELDNREGYHLGDLIGRRGLEEQYENLLHGEDGFMLVTRYASGRPQLRTDKYGMPYIARRDSRGHILAEEGRRKEPAPGDPLHLTLDISLQQKCEDLLKGEVGTITVLDARSGAVLAMASSPGYDPGVFVTRGRNKERLALLQENYPRRMLHRAFQEQYPPGSVFKVLLAAAALEEGIITPETTFFCPGHFRLSGVQRRWHCHKRSGHGSVNLLEALTVSCDVFFYNIGLELGVDRMEAWAEKFGLGQPTGIDLPGEVKGLVPGRQWKAERNRNLPVWEQKWYPGETLNFSIGQGSMSTTPLQNAVMMACVINGGCRVRPYLNREFGPEISENFIGDKALATVIEGMRTCVERHTFPRGTGRRAYIPGVTVLGKTGSAQVMALSHHEEYETEEDIPWKMRDHAWFVAGVPDRDPPIAMCILVEHGHHGSTVAAPLAREIILHFYGLPDPGPLEVASAGGSTE